MNYLHLVNKTHELSPDFVPSTLVEDPVTKICLCKKALQAVCRLNEKLEKEGLEPIVLVSGYRSYDYQEGLYRKKINKLIEEGIERTEASCEAAKIVAKPGTSEHQLGLAADFTLLSMQHLEDPLITYFGLTSTGMWLQDRSHEEGFILRYPKDKVSLTGITYEPWHYRYVGKKEAHLMKALNICLEEYHECMKG